MNEPLVSICCQTYNHKNYIKEAIESFLMQKTNFAFEILLRDDASTDGTVEICKDYAAKYPDLINLLAYEENQFSKGVKPFADNVKRARGKYIAICEGDDYWIDPLKLQKQVDFLEANPEYGMTFSNVNFVNDFNAVINPSDYHQQRQSKLQNGYMFYEYLKGDFSIMTNTVVFRKDLLNSVNLLNSIDWFVYDVWIYQRIMMVSKIYKFDEKMGCYRNAQDSITKTGYTINKADYVLYDNLLFFKNVRNKNKYPLNDGILLKLVMILLISSKIKFQNKLYLVPLIFNYFPKPKILLETIMHWYKKK